MGFRNCYVTHHEAPYGRDHSLKEIIIYSFPTPPFKATLLADFPGADYRSGRISSPKAGLTKFRATTRNNNDIDTKTRKIKIKNKKERILQVFIQKLGETCPVVHKATDSRNLKNKPNTRTT